MRNIALVFALLIIASFTFAQAPVPSTEVQIKGAMLAAPSDKRDGALIYGYSEKGEFVVLRKGTNDLVCIADDPNQDGFSAACYHNDLEPFMTRGRALRKDGKSRKEIFETREAEAKSGKLVMPKQPSTLFVYFASKDDYDAATGDVRNGNFRYVIYTPYATAESTGLPLKPEAPGMPWIMDPGTHGAHIMINPPKAQ